MGKCAKSILSYTLNWICILIFLLEEAAIAKVYHFKPIFMNNRASSDVLLNIELVRVFLTSREAQPNVLVLFVLLNLLLRCTKEKPYSRTLHALPYNERKVTLNSEF
jgi:hypothetical protein